MKELFNFQDVDTLREPELFKKMAAVSVALHISLFLFFMLKATFFPSESLNLEAAVRVDMVALPDKITELPPQVDNKTVAEKPTSMPKPKEDVVDLSRKKKSALDKIREFEKEEKKKKSIKAIEEELRKQEEAERLAKAQKYLVKGNVISRGTSLKGLTKSEFNEYVGQLHSHIQNHWNLPEWLQDTELKAAVTAYIDSSGKVIKKRLVTSSGNNEFDQLALKAVDDAAPFPAPPEKFVDIVRYDGITFGFPK